MPCASRMLMVPPAIAQRPQPRSVLHGSRAAQPDVAHSGSMPAATGGRQGSSMCQSGRRHGPSGGGAIVVSSASGPR